jgi:hypothetical protein
MSLFDSTPYERPIPLRPKRTEGQRRNARIAQKIELGRHPLAGIAGAGDLRLGPEGETCGGCQFRSPQEGTAYPKCRFGAYEVTRTGYEGWPYTATRYPRVSNSVQSDCRASWPACCDFQPKGDA